MTLATSIAQSGANNVTMRNRIINGGMTIAQRGTSTTTNFGVWMDMWRYSITGPSAMSIAQSSTAPAGFSNSLLVTITTGAAIGSSLNYVSQSIEGFNTADLGWGTASASTVTLSFWVRSSLTGTFGGFIYNSAADYTYPFSYTISSANTWEQKTITITGPTAGTWIGATNGNGMQVGWSIGAGSTYLWTAGAWAASQYFGATGQTNLIGTSGATFYITGVQLEKGSTATSFDYRPYGNELYLCQRYFQSFKRAGEDNNQGWLATSYNANTIYLPIQFFTIMRRVPDVLSGGAWRTRQSNLNAFTASFGYQQSGTGGCVLAQSASTNAASSVFWVEPDGSYSTAYLAFNGEL